MSGFEAAGLALAILPLIVSAAKHYEDCFRPFSQYKKFAKEAEFFCTLLNVQKTIFRNQCSILLEEIADHDAALGILNGASHPSQSDQELEKRLGQLLGESKESCAAIIKTIQDKLSDVESESQQLGFDIEQERQKDTQSVGDKAWRGRVANKLRFSFGRSSRLDQTLTALRYLNNDFVTLSQQATKPTVSHMYAPKVPSQVSSVEIEKYQTIGQASCQVYEALGKACTKHTEHQAHFCVEVDQELTHESRASRLKFNIGFTHLKLTGSAQRDDLLWFVVNSIIGDDAAKPGSKGTVNRIAESLTQSLKRQIEPDHGATTQKEKRVRFQFSTPVPPSMPSLLPESIPNSFTSYDSMRKDLCDYLRRYVRQSAHQGALAVVFLEIAHSSTLETLQRPIDLMNGQENPYTEFFVARRLAKSEYSDLGLKYHKIVERLVECDFGCGDDLSSRQLQIAIYSEVVCPLEQLEQGLRKLYLGL
ncbi:MAG: hypothetical protein Q9161_009750 [Pseudevernia consocians]